MNSDLTSKFNGLPFDFRNAAAKCMDCIIGPELDPYTFILELCIFKTAHWKETEVLK